VKFIILVILLSTFFINKSYAELVNFNSQDVIDTEKYMLLKYESVDSFFAGKFCKLIFYNLEDKIVIRNHINYVSCDKQIRKFKTLEE
jgi:hypothetical protein